MGIGFLLYKPGPVTCSVFFVLCPLFFVFGCCYKAPRLHAQQQSLRSRLACCSLRHSHTACCLLHDHRDPHKPPCLCVHQQSQCTGSSTMQLAMLPTYPVMRQPWRRAGQAPRSPQPQSLCGLSCYPIHHQCAVPCPAHAQTDHTPKPALLAHDDLLDRGKQTKL